MFIGQGAVALPIPFVYAGDGPRDGRIQKVSVFIVPVLCSEVHTENTIDAKFFTRCGVVFASVLFLKIGTRENLLVVSRADRPARVKD